MGSERERETCRRAWVKKRKGKGWCAVGAGGGEEEKKAYLVQGETSGGARRRKKVLLRSSSDCCVRMCEVLLRRVSGGAG
ncbi:hypothetical protein MRB53_005987 [Persea americana]|uniref:Uncharacterized protein n=1 Tax=Persea americana TaxID=3435 RepID=A0ACC2MF45_PERAE|nr:hypothetical protein MRB53_005987 [Persea americana]